MDLGLESEDRLPGLISKLALCTQEQWALATYGKPDSIATTNLALHSLRKTIDEDRWLEEMTTHLFCRAERLKFTSKQKIGSEFAYVPTPGTRNGNRIKHPCEYQHRKALSVLSHAPSMRSRELAWFIPYKTTAGAQNLIFIFTFDPNHAIQVRTLSKSWEECNAYWRNALEATNLLPPGENTSCIHTFTSLQEWMEVLDTNDGEESPTSWRRRDTNPFETSAAAKNSLDIYYSTPTVAYAWSTLEKQKGRERAQNQLQQAIGKKVILFDPIYGRWPGQKKDTKKLQVQIPSSGETEEEKTAKSFWENTVLTAQESGSSDIHIEPMQVTGKNHCDLIVSLRKDGQLNFHTKIPSFLAQDYARFALETSGILREETRKPQDGRRSWTNPKTGVPIDLRISVTPVGTPVQKIVMRLLDTSKLKRGISDLGLENEESQIWEKALGLNQSLVLVSGPTNSGKSTTLYAALLSIYQRDNRRSFATIEDPVEYRLPFRATQSPVQEDRGVTYEKLIRQAMRNDGDTFLIGEIRDKNTAAAALQLSLTGHQVLSSIHANNSSETALRLLEFGIEPYLISETVKLIVAQKLIPTCCPHCKFPLETREVGPSLRKNGGEILLETYNGIWERKYRSHAQWSEGQGCPQCQFTGLLGMTPAQEFLIIDQKNKKFLKEGNIDKLTESMRERSLLTMEETVWKLAWQGKIPVSQAGEITNQLKNA